MSDENNGTETRTSQTRAKADWKAIDFTHSPARCSLIHSSLFDVVSVYRDITVISHRKVHQAGEISRGTFLGVLKRSFLEGRRRSLPVPMQGTASNGPGLETSSADAKHDFVWLEGLRLLLISSKKQVPVPTGTIAGKWLMPQLRVSPMCGHMQRRASIRDPSQAARH